MAMALGAYPRNGVIVTANDPSYGEWLRSVKCEQDLHFSKCDSFSSADKFFVLNCKTNKFDQEASLSQSCQATLPQKEEEEYFTLPENPKVEFLKGQTEPCEQFELADQGVTPVAEVSENDLKTGIHDSFFPSVAAFQSDSVPETRPETFESCPPSVISAASLKSSFGSPPQVALDGARHRATPDLPQITDKSEIKSNGEISNSTELPNAETVANPLRTGKTGFQGSSFKASALLGLLLFLSFISFAAALNIREKCKNYLTLYHDGLEHCPFTSQTKLDEICCPSNTSFHCEAHDSGQLTHIGCYVPTPVKPGFYRSIANNKLQFHACSNDTFNPGGQISTDVEMQYPYCPQTKSGKKEGSRKYCLGGTTGDDRYQCKQGNKPVPFNDSCVNFIGSDPCYCEKMTCGDGEDAAPLPDPPSSCDEEPHHVHDIYKCTSVSSPPDKSTPITGTTSTDLSTTKPPPSQSKDTILPVIIIVPILVFLGIAGLCLYMYRRPESYPRVRRLVDTIAERIRGMTGFQRQLPAQNGNLMHNGNIGGDIDGGNAGTTGGNAEIDESGALMGDGPNGQTCINLSPVNDQSNHLNGPGVEDES